MGKIGVKSLCFQEVPMFPVCSREMVTVRRSNQQIHGTAIQCFHIDFCVRMKNVCRCSVSVWFTLHSFAERATLAGEELFMFSLNLYLPPARRAQINVKGSWS